MHDLEEIRAFRAAIQEPGRDRLAPGRTALLAAAEAPRVRRRVPWRFSLAAGAVAAAALTAFVVLPAESEPQFEATPVSASVFLERAAQTAEKQPEARPGTQEWIYTRTYQREVRTKNSPSAPDKTEYVENWTRFDGLKTAGYQPVNGKTKLVITDEKWVKDNKDNKDSEERTPAQWYDHFRSLPEEPSELLKSIYASFDGYKTEELGGKLSRTEDARNQWVFRRLGGFLGNQSLPPSFEAVVYRTLAEVPGVEVKEDVVDALGRAGTAVSRTDAADGVREEFIIEPSSVRYLGTRMVHVREMVFSLPSRPGGPVEEHVIPAGHVGADQALVDSAVVDRPGLRP